MLSQRNLLALNLIVLLAIGVLGARRNPDLSTQLWRMEQRMTEEIQALREQLEECTPERYRLNQCAPNEAPFELAVTLCGEMGLEANLEGTYALEAKASGQAGVGWKAALDVDLKAEGAIPIVLTIPGTPIPIGILPTELAVSGSGKGGLGIEGCIEGVKAPLSEFLSRDQILALLDRLEAGSEGLATAIAAVSGALPFSAQGVAAGPALDTQRLAAAITAARSFGTAEFNGSDPLAVFDSPAVAALRDALPVSRFSERLLEDPSVVLSRVNPNAQSVCDNIAGLPSVSGRLDGLCDFADGLPEVGEQVAMLQRVNQLHDQVQDLPDVIRFLIQEALPDLPAPQPVLPPSSWFCSRFPRLCLFQ